MTQTMSVKDTRNNLADIINRVDSAGDIFVITKFGKAKAMIVPVAENTVDKTVAAESFGAWKKRKDIKDSSSWVADMRSKMSKRYA